MSATIHVKNEVKDKLDKLKIHRREPYNDVIERLIRFYEDVRKELERLKQQPDEPYTSVIKRLAEFYKKHSGLVGGGEEK